MSSGFSSMKRVVMSPAKKMGWLSTFSRKGMLVLTPRMRDSVRARTTLRVAAGNVDAVPVS